MLQRTARIVRHSHIVRLFCMAVAPWLLLAVAPDRALGGGPPCPSDINSDGAVNIDDLLGVISTWGPCSQQCPPSCMGDIAPTGGNCTVDVDDLLSVIGGWGPCPTCPGTLTWCFGSCRDLANDPTFCGTTCENAVVCGQFKTCTGGVCVPVELPPPPP